MSEQKYHFGFHGVSGTNWGADSSSAGDGPPGDYRRVTEDLRSCGVRRDRKRKRSVWLRSLPPNGASLCPEPADTASCARLPRGPRGPEGQRLSSHCRWPWRGVCSPSAVPRHPGGPSRPSAGKPLAELRADAIRAAGVPGRRAGPPFPAARGCATGGPGTPLGEGGGDCHLDRDNWAVPDLTGPRAFAGGRDYCSP